MPMKKSNQLSKQVSRYMTAAIEGTQAPAASRRPLLAVGLALSLAAGACGVIDDADEFRQGVPRHEDVTIVVPASSTQQSALTADGAGVSQIQGALLGERAELYKLTRDITVMVNGGTVAVLTLVKTITTYPPSSIATDVAVWGPHTNPLSPNTWRLTVNRLDKGRFHYALDAKAKTADDSAYLTILSGNHSVVDPGSRRRGGLPAYGSGDFEMNWDAAQMLPEHDDNVGKAHFVYNRPSATANVTIDVTFTQVKDDETGMLIDAKYGFVETPGAGGRFQFTLTKDAIATTPALETLTVRSRWQETGAGRSDVKFSGGDLAASEATANECWDTNFVSVFQTNSYGDAAKMWGAEASCDSGFPTAEYAVF